MKKILLLAFGILFCFGLLNAQCDADGGMISTDDPTTICADGNSPDPINVSLTDNIGTNSGWVITDPDGNILGLPPGPPFDLDGAGAGTCLIWHISFENDLMGAEVGNNANDLTGCFDLSNPITVTRINAFTDGGTITTNDPLEICAGDGVADPIDVLLTDNIGTNSAWVITDPNGNILGLPPAPPFDLEGAGSGTCLIWHLSFEDGLVGAEVGNNAADLQGCYDLSNPITVTRIGVDGGEITTTDPTTICAGDGEGNPIDVTLTDNEGTNSAWVITDPDGNILGLPPGPPFDLDGAGAGTCYIWHLSFEDGLTGVDVGNNAADLQGCFDLSNPIIVERYTGMTDGGDLTTIDGFTELTICAGDGISDAFDVSLTGNEGTNSAWVITDPNGNILGLPPAPPFDLEGAGSGTCLVWHLSFEDGLTGAEVGNNAADLQGCFDLSNPITVTRNGVNGGELATVDGATELTICAGDGISDAFDVSLTGNLGTNSAWVITDPNGNILGLPPAPPFDLEGAGSGTCLVWHLSFEDGLTGAEVGNNAADLQGCFDLSNPITVTRNGVNGGELATVDGATELTICAGDGISDAFDVTLTGNEGTNSAWVITDPNGNILGLPPAPPFDLEGAGSGTCLVWHLSFEDGLTGAEVGNNAADLQGCFDLSNPITVTRNGVNGGELATVDGATELTICAGDGISDAFDVTLTGNEGTNSAWVITDPNGNILGLPPAPPFDLEGAGSGTCLVWHLSFEDGLTGAEIGNNAADLQGCFDLSNPITVTRNGVNGGELATVDGATELTICAGDGISDAFDVSLTGNEGTNSAWVITDPNGNILGLPPAPPFDLEGAGSGTCLVWHLSFEDGLTGAEVGNNAADLQGCFDLSNPITVTRLTGSDCNPSEGVDIELEISVDNLLYNQYEHVVYTLTVSNMGSETATGVDVHAGLPNGMVYSDDETDKGEYRLYYERWEVGTLEPGEEATLELTLFTLVEDVDITNFVQVIATDQEDVDSTPNNDTNQTPDEDDEAAITIVPASNGGTGTGMGDADLSLAMTVDNNEYEQYGYTTFILTLMNDGPDDATGILVSVPLPEGFKYSDHDAGTGEYSLWRKEWSVPTLASGESTTLELVFFSVTDEPMVDYFVQVFIANENDPDSTPGNDTNQVADEDDEAAITLTFVGNFNNGSGNLNTASINAGRDNFKFKLDQLYPNPATSEITVELESFQDFETTLQIVSLEGKLIMHENVDMTKGFNKYQFDISNLPEGAYFIRLVEDSGSIQYKRFVKIR